MAVWHTSVVLKQRLLWRGKNVFFYNNLQSMNNSLWCNILCGTSSWCTRYESLAVDSFRQMKSGKNLINLGDFLRDIFYQDIWVLSKSRGEGQDLKRGQRGGAMLPKKKNAPPPPTPKEVDYSHQSNYLESSLPGSVCVTADGILASWRGATP